jgi:DNA recombination protein RmuC
MQWLILLIGVVIGLIVGLLLEHLRAGKGITALQLQLTTKQQEVLALREAASEKEKWIESAEKQLREAFDSLANRALETSSDRFLKNAREQIDALLTQVRGDWGIHKEQLGRLVEPLEKTLEKMDGQVRLLEEKRAGAYQRLEKHLQQLGQDQSQLRNATLKLEQALKSSSIRGRWGELQLRRVMELAGMSAHIDFDEQVTTDEGRPDVIVHLPNNGFLPVDAKTPMASYFEALNTEGDEQHRLLVSHTQAMKSRIQDLSRKSYWSQFERAPEMVVMFIPSEASLSAAFSQDPSLLEFAMERHVLVASPVLLLALLRSVAYGWQQQEIAKNAREIAQQGHDLYERILRFLDLFQKTGKGLGQAVDAYDKAVGSLESRLMPSARKFKELNAESKDLPEVTPLDRQPRLLAVTDEDHADFT